MRVAICGRNLNDLRGYLAGFPAQICQHDPEIVISYGGDGALLGAERDFPGVPKCPIRDRRSTPKCSAHGESAILQMLFDGTLPVSTLTKVQAVKDGELKAVGLNDIVISRRKLSSAVRYRIWLDEERYASQVVGDGPVVATPFGSTGYYRSITHSLFRLGIGLAFNNSTEPIDHLVLDESTRITAEILRGPAVLFADNDPQQTFLEAGDRVEITRTDERATILGLDVFRCAQCYALRQSREDPSRGPRDLHKKAILS